MRGAPRPPGRRRLLLGESSPRRGEIVVFSEALDVVAELAREVPAPEWQSVRDIESYVIAHEAGHLLVHGSERRRLT